MNFITSDDHIRYTDGSETLAEITFYESAPGVWCINHTEVSPVLQGQGIAGKLVQLAVDEIKARGGKPTATCSYAAHWLEKHPEVQD